MASKYAKVIQHPKRGFPVWLKRLFIGGILLVILLLLSAYAFQAYTTSRTTRRYPPPGKMVDVGGYRLHYRSNGSGSPVVVLDSGLTGDSNAWALVQPGVAKFTRVISYDRAGLGWSDRGPKDRTSRQIVKELHTMLETAKIPGPYVLVGASFGGFNVRMFTHEYPEQVAGLVLVDSPHELEFFQVPESIKRDNEKLTPLVKVTKFLTPFGIGHLVLPGRAKDVPEEVRDVKLALSLRTSNLMTTCEEYLDTGISNSQMKGWTLQTDIPIAVLSSSRSRWPEAPPDDQLTAINISHKLQAELAGQSTNSYQYIVPDCGHAIFFEKPDVVVDSIRRVVESVRNHTKLTAPD